MKFTAAQIAEVLDGNVDGSPEVEVHTLSKIEEGKEGSLTFLSNPKYTPFIYSTQATITIVNRNFKPKKKIKTTLIRVDDSYQAFTKLLEFYNQNKPKKNGICENTSIADSATYGADFYLGEFSSIGQNVKIGDNVKIHPQVFIGDNVNIGSNTTIYSGVKIYEGCIIGTNCSLDSNVVIGADGFGFAPDENGHYTKIPQIGNVVIQDNVDIGAGTTIDRATMGSTLISTGVKLDNLIQVAHNVTIGAHTVIAAQTGIAGSTKIGAHCQIGGQVGIGGHLTIGDHVIIQAQSGVANSVSSDQRVQGTPAFNYRAYSRSYVYFKKLPEIKKELDQINKQLKHDS